MSAPRNKLSRPFKAEVLRRHIETAITEDEFRLFPTNSDPTQLKLDVDPTTLNYSSHVSDILVADKESDMYTPPAKLLTEISCVVHRLGAKDRHTSAFSDKNSLIMFIPCSRIIHEADNGEWIKPDFAGVEVTAEEVTEYLEKGSTPDRFSSSHWCHLLSVGEAKIARAPALVGKSDFLQLLSFVWCANRYQLNHFIHTAMLAYKTGFITLQCRPDSATISPTRQYSDYEALI